MCGTFSQVSVFLKAKPYVKIHASADNTGLTVQYLLLAAMGLSILLTLSHYTVYFLCLYGQ